MRFGQTRCGCGMTVAACLWLGLFPLLQGGTYSHITYDKWVIFLILTAVTAVCFLFDLLLSVRRKPAVSSGTSVPRPRVSCLPAVLAAVLLLWIFLSCLTGGSSRDTWWIGSSVRYEGLATQLCYFALFLAFFFARVDLRPVLYSAAAGVTVFLIVVLMQRSGGNPLGLYPRGTSYATGHEFQGTIGNIDMGTGYLLLLSGLFLHGLLRSLRGLRAAGGRHSDHGKTEPKRLPAASVILAAVCFLALAVSVFLIVTMEVQFGLISLCVLLVVTLFRFIPKKARFPFLVLLGVLVLLVVWFWPGEGGGLWELHEIFHGRTRLSFGSNRLAVWAYSLRLAGEDLLFGGGSGTYRSRFNQYIEANGLVIPSEQDGVPLPHYFDNPHNEYVSLLVNHGLPALLLFLALLFIAVWHRRDRLLPLLTPCSAAVLCYAVQAFFSFSVCIVAPMFWVLFGLSFKD